MPSLDPDLEKICSTLKCILQNRGSYEIILVLQKTSPDKKKEIENMFGSYVQMKVIFDSGIGISRARNIAIKASVGRWMLLLDDDVCIDSNIITDLNGRLSSNELFYYGNVLINNTKTHYVNFFVINKNLDIWSYNRVCSASLVINRKVFDGIGLFDEDLGSGCELGSSEESDLIIRALLSKIKIKYLDCYTVYHEQAMHSMQKVENYAKGGGAIYRKYLYSKNLKLYLKFSLDLLLRVVLLFSFQKKRYIFLKGFIIGFARYGANKCE